MKNLRSYIASITTVMMILFTSNTIAQNNSDIPTPVLTAFTAKYPKAEIKKWTVTDDSYTAKAREGSEKYFASFDKNGNWIKTSTKFSWPWHLNPELKQGFRKSKYSAWHIYGINKVEKPSGQYYEILVDDANHKISAFHQELLTANWLLEFKANGQFVREKNINDAPTQ